MDIKQNDEGKKGEFYIEENGEKNPLIQYFHTTRGHQYLSH